MTKQLQQIGSLFTIFLAAGDYDNARAALDEFRAAKGAHNGNSNSRIHSNDRVSVLLTDSVCGEHGRV